MPNSPHCFTVTYTGISPILFTPVKVGAAFDPHTPTPQLHDYTGIWDTGATATAITQKVIDDCALKPIGMTKVHGADGEFITEVYFVSILLLNGVGFRTLRVTKGKLGPGADLLIGMDIITAGDFAVTNYNGKTVLSFRIPSSEFIDFSGKAAVPSTVLPTKLPGVGRNDPCPCGSGKKYKKCHGSANPPPTPLPNPFS
jgi:SEC-C motif/Aspartyl protease